MRKHRWAGGSLVLLAGAAMVTVGALGATAETTSMVSDGSSPSISLGPLDSLLQPVVQIVTQPPAPAPAEPAAPQPATEVEQVAPATVSTGPSGLAGEILAAMNADRAANGLAPLSWNDELGDIAENWAGVIAQGNSLTHQDMNAMAARTGFAKTGENLLYAPAGYSAADMETLWMNSPSHRANILDPAFSMAGVGLATGADGSIWAAVDFGG